MLSKCCSTLFWTWELNGVIARLYVFITLLEAYTALKGAYRLSTRGRSILIFVVDRTVNTWPLQVPEIMGPQIRPLDTRIYTTVITSDKDNRKSLSQEQEQYATRPILITDARHYKNLKTNSPRTRTICDSRLSPPGTGNICYHKTSSHLYRNNPLSGPRKIWHPHYRPLR